MAVDLAIFFNCYYLLLNAPKYVVNVLFAGNFIGVPLQIKSNPPIYSSLPVNTFSKSIIVKTSSKSPHFNSKSTGVFDVIDGLAFTSNNQGFNYASSNMSKPYNSKQCLSFIIIF